MIPSRDELINRLFVIRVQLPFVCALSVCDCSASGSGEKCWIRRIYVPRNPWDIVIADGVGLDDHVVLLTTGSRSDKARDWIIGAGTYVNRFTMFDASESIEVGRNCLIGPFCYITDHDHGIETAWLHCRAASCRQPGPDREQCLDWCGCNYLEGRHYREWCGDRRRRGSDASC